MSEPGGQLIPSVPCRLEAHIDGRKLGPRDAQLLSGLLHPIRGRYLYPAGPWETVGHHGSDMSTPDRMELNDSIVQVVSLC